VVDARSLERRTKPAPAPVPETRPEPAPEPDRAAEEREAQRRQAEAERQAREEKARQEAEARKKAEAQRLQEAERKAAQEKAAKEKAAAEKRAAEKRAAEKAAAERKAAEAAAQARRAEEARKREAAELARMLAEEEALLAARDSGALADYMNLINQKVKRNWTKPLSARPGVECEVTVTQIPGGEVMDVVIGRCNGDEALRRSVDLAFRKASPLPLPDDPALFKRTLKVLFKPED
jgi:colicin import membrane protein